MDQLFKGAKLKIIGKAQKNSYESISVKLIIKDKSEVIMNKSKNYYFNVDVFLSGKSWVKECYLLDEY